MKRTNVTQRKLTRRDFIKITAVAGGVLLGGSLLRIPLKTKGVTVHDTRLLMGTVIDITLVAEGEKLGRAALDDTYAEMKRLIRIFDYRQSTSQLGQLNRNGETDGASRELVDVIERAKHYGDISGGAFDITVLPVLRQYQAGLPLTSRDLALVDYRQVKVEDRRIEFGMSGMQITLDGIAKGRVVDGGVDALKALGYENVLVEAGGDLLAEGSHPDGSLWKVGVANPRPSEGGDQWLTTLSVDDRAVATSGDYMHTFTSDYSLNHIIDPRTGLSPAELSSATVIAPSVTEADALATTLMVLGVAKGLSLVEGLPDVEALVATKDLTIHRTSGFPTA